MTVIPGIRFNLNRAAEITVWAPFAKKVAIQVSDRPKETGLQRDLLGYWTGTTSDIKPGDHYRVIVDDQELPDIASLSQPQGVHGPSEAVDLGHYQWKDVKWENPRIEHYISYEIHTGTFTPEGTFAGIASKLDYLKELGVNAIEIMPVAQFPGERNWGYDGVFPFAVQNSYGGAFGLMQLIDTCHRKGIAVILDVVYNHLGPEGNYFNEFGPYFTDKYHTPWGDAINFDDAWCDAVRNYYIQNALMWFRDFHADALRLDAVHAIKDFSPTHILREIKQRVNLLEKETRKSYHLIVELDLNDNRFIDPLEKMGYGMDAQWIDEFHHALRVTAGEKRTGYYADFDGICHLAKSYNDAYVYDGIYSTHRHKTFGTRADGNPGKQFVVFSQNHDHVGNRMLGERSSRLYSHEMQKLMAGAVLISPFLPLLFMGEEWGAESPFLYFTSHGDPELAEAVRKGRKAEFKDFHNEGEAPDPQSPDTFLQSKLSWDELLLGKSQHLLDYYKTLIALRKQLPALHVPDRSAIKTTVDEEQQTLLVQRWHKEQEIACLMNFSKKEQTVKTALAANWQKILDSADEQWAGPGTSIRSGIIQPESMIIYLNGYV
jgi:maltooligosyltrehalose trehalohydrolase